MAEPINRLAMFSAPVADDQVNMLAPQLPAGHPANLLMWVRDQIPQVQADDSSLASGIYSRLGRTATAIPRAGLETMANWLRGTHDPNAVRIGEDTIAPLGLFGMAGMAAKAPQAARAAESAAMGGDTIRAYHGTNARFEKFDPSKTNEAGFHFGTEPQANARRESHGSDGMFSRWQNIPVNIDASRILDLKGDPGWFGGTALARHLNKEGIMPDDVVAKVRQMEAKDLNGANKYIREWLVDQGYDLVRYPNRVEGGGDFSYMALGTGNVRNADTGKVMFADNAKSSVPGTVVNAMGEQPTTMADLMRLGFGNRDSAEIEWRKRPYDERRAEFEDAIRTHQYKIDEENDIPVPFRYRSLPPSHDDVVRMDSILSLPRKREDVDLSNIWATQGSVDGSAVSNILKRGPDGVDGGEFNAPVAYRALDGSIWLRDGHHRTSAAAARGDPTTEMIVMGSHPIASAPGLAANATQEDSPVLSILSKYGLY